MISMLTNAQLTRFFSNFTPHPESLCWEWNVASGLTKSGHARFWIGTIPEAAHRLSWRIFHGEIPYGSWVLHHCDNAKCVNPNHLYLGDHKQNTKDAVERGRVARGEQNSHAKLTEEKVRQIRELASKGASRSELARMFGVRATNISMICLRQTWKHVP